MTYARQTRALGFSDSETQSFIDQLNAKTEQLRAAWPLEQTEYPVSFVLDIYDQLTVAKQFLTKAMNDSFVAENISVYGQIRAAGSTADTWWLRTSEMITGVRGRADTYWPVPTDTVRAAESTGRKTVSLPRYREAVLTTMANISLGLEQIIYLNQIRPWFVTLAGRTGIIDALGYMGRAAIELGKALKKGSLLFYQPISKFADIMRYSVYLGGLYVLWLVLKPKPKPKGASA